MHAVTTQGWPIHSDRSTCTRTHDSQGLLAVSALVRHNAPGLEQLRLAGGLPRLVKLAADPDRRVARSVSVAGWRRWLEAALLMESCASSLLKRMCLQAHRTWIQLKDRLPHNPPSI